jgi:beta-galactosidase
VDSEALAFQGGLPGPLQETLGVWVEEIDSLYSDMSNSFSWKGKSYKVKDFCDLLHLEGAEALATYNSNFYKGLPALTVNHYGNGAAYYIAARSTGDFLSDFYRHLVDESSVVRVLDGPLPPGVTAQLRSDGTTDYVFLLNFSPHSVSIDTGFAGVKALEPWEVAILERH